MSEVTLGDYPQMTGDAAKETLRQGTQVPAEAKAYVKDWLLEAYGVSLD